MEGFKKILGYTKEDINTDEYLFGTSENTLYGRMKHTYELYYDTTIKEILPYKPIISQLAEVVEQGEKASSEALPMIRKAVELALTKINEEYTQLEIKTNEPKQINQTETEVVNTKLQEDLNRQTFTMGEAEKILKSLKNIDISYNDVESAKYIQNMEEVKFNKLLKSYIIYNRFDKDINLFDEDTTITSNMVVIEERSKDEKYLPFLIYNNSFFNISGKTNIQNNNKFLYLLKIIFAKVKMVGQISYTHSDSGFESDISERLNMEYKYQDEWTIEKPGTIMNQCDQNMKRGVWMTYTDKDIYYMISPYFLEYLYKGTDDKKWFGENYNLPKSSQEMEDQLKYDKTFNQPNLFGRIFVPINVQGHGYQNTQTIPNVEEKNKNVERSILGAKYKIRQYGIKNAKESEFNRINNHFYSNNWAQGKVTGGKSKNSSKKYTAKKKK